MRATRRVSPILLYHATFRSVPDQLGPLVHNVHPDRLIEQLDWLGEHYRWISVDEWFSQGRPAGTACVTFDDGYRSVFTEVIPRLIERGIPSTVFLNGSSLRGEVFWRDRVVFIVRAGLTQDFLQSRFASDHGVADIDPDEFYDQSRWPDWSSRAVDLATHEYLTDIGRHDEVGRYLVTDRSDLIDHPLVSYGSHTYRHYVPASLSRAELISEFVDNDRVLAELGLPRSKVFAIPFGRPEHIDDETVRLVTEMGFIGMLFSRHAVNFPGHHHDLDGVLAGERYMVPDDLPSLQTRHVRLSVLNPQGRLRRSIQRVVPGHAPQHA